MLVNEFLKRAAARLGDEERITFSSKELISCLNDAITQVSLERINAKDPQMITEAEIAAGGSPVPEGFVKFAGQEPCYVAGGKIVPYTDAACTARCYCAKPHVLTKGDDVPFDETTAAGALLDYVVVLAGSRVGYASQTEAALARQMADAYTGGAGHAAQNS